MYLASLTWKKLEEKITKKLLPSYPSEALKNMAPELPLVPITSLPRIAREKARYPDINHGASYIALWVCPYMLPFQEPLTWALKFFQK